MWSLMAAKYIFYYFWWQTAWCFLTSGCSCAYDGSRWQKQKGSGHLLVVSKQLQLSFKWFINNAVLMTQCRHGLRYWAFQLFLSDSFSFCYPSLCLPSPEGGWRHEHYLIPFCSWHRVYCVYFQDSSSFLAFLLFFLCRHDLHYELSAQLRAKGGQRLLKYFLCTPYFCQCVTSLGLKIAHSSTFVPLANIINTKGKFLLCAKLLSGANEGRTLTSVRSRCHGDPY